MRVVNLFASLSLVSGILIIWMYTMVTLHRGSVPLPEDRTYRSPSASRGFDQHKEHTRASDMKSNRHSSQTELTHILKDAPCFSTKEMLDILPAPREYSSEDNWSFKTRVKCPKSEPKARMKKPASLEYLIECCKERDEVVNGSFGGYILGEIPVLSVNSSCLSHFVESCCFDGKMVPNLVHYVWYFHKEMKYTMFVSMLSVIRIIKPCLIIFHGDNLPYGQYWDSIVNIYTRIVHVKRDRYTHIFGQPIKFHEHGGDVMRIEALQKYGGIYLDTDYIFLKNIDSFRDYNATLCYQSSGYWLNSVIFSKPNARFLSLWMEGYVKDYRPLKYVYNSMRYNGVLAEKHPNLVHIEHGTLCRPDALVGKELDLASPRNWTDQYGVHLYTRTINSTLNNDVIRQLNTTLGSMLRHIVLGNKEMCLN